MRAKGAGRGKSGKEGKEGDDKKVRGKEEGG